MILSRPLRAVKRSISLYKNISRSILPSKKFKFFYRFSNMSLSDAGKRVNDATEGSIPESESFHKIGGPFVRQSKPQFLDERAKIFEELYQQQLKHLSEAPKIEILIRLKDGKEIKGTSFQTTAFDIAKGISKNLAERVLAAKVSYIKKVEFALDNGRRIKKKITIF